MSHECPDCGQLCFCGADVDDCMNNFEKDVMNCTHYLQCENEDDEEYYDDDMAVNEIIKESKQ